MIKKQFSWIRKVFLAFEKAILAIDQEMNNSTTKTQSMDITKLDVSHEKLQQKYNEGLAYGFKNINNPDFSTVYNKLLKSRENLQKHFFAAFQAGLQDGYHNHGRSHFDEWYREDFLLERESNVKSFLEVIKASGIK